MSEGQSPVVVDLETKNTFADVGGREHLLQLEISLVGTYDYQNNVYRAYREHEFDALGPLLRGARFVIGFNSEGFDLPILAARLGDWVYGLRSLDLMLQACPPPNRRLPLSAFAAGSLNAAKSADGLQAVQFYREGRWEELERYCLDDVRLTRELFEYGLKNGAFKYNLGKRNGVVPVAYPHQAPYRMEPAASGVDAPFGNQPEARADASDLTNRDVRFTYRNHEKQIRVTAVRRGLLIGNDESGQERAFPLARLEILEVS